ncbi:hypothetical protein BCV70DRAFT_147486, partial [Testicularia cyperi]
PTFKDIKAKNAQFAATARENAGKPRLRQSQLKSEDGQEVSKEQKSRLEQNARRNVKPARNTRAVSSSSVTKSKSPLGSLTLAVICFVVVGGVFFELLRLF